jgi:hypothetical protein
MEEMKSILTPEAGKGNLLAVAKNGYGRCCLHIAVLCEDEEMTEFIATNFRETLRAGDNVSEKLLYQYRPKDKHTKNVQKRNDEAAFISEAATCHKINLW